MKAQILKTNILTISSLILFSVFVKAQDPESFFPHNIGDRWDYVELHSDYSSYYFRRGPIIRDSIGVDGSHNLFYTTLLNYPQYRMDSSLNVFEMPQDSFLNFLLYKLDADTGEVWENPLWSSPRWAWVARVESLIVFSKLTTVKIFRYGPAYPDSAGELGLLENWLASGFGLIYSESENNITYLNGCIVAGDTFGIITSAKISDPEIPDEFLLKQNYPNPFNPSTTIEFELPNEGEIKISVYNILGQQVGILYDGWKSAGTYKIKWDASGLASGIYLCRLQANENIRSIKMVLSK